jgi:hypothetical protein
MLHILHTEYILHTQCIFVHSIPRDDKHTIIAYTPLLHTQYILHTPYIFIHRIPRDALAGHRERESSWIAKRERVRGTQRCTCGTSREREFVDSKERESSWYPEMHLRDINGGDFLQIEHARV